MKKSSEVYRRNNNGPKTLPYGIPDTMLTSLLLQPSTITCCERFDRNSVNIDHTEPPIPIEQGLYRIPSWYVDPIKGCDEINLYDPSLLPIFQCTLQCMRRTQKCITCTQTFPISKLDGWKHTTAFHKSSEANLRREVSYGKIRLSTVVVTQDLLSGMPLVL